MTEQSSTFALPEALLNKYDFDLADETSEQLITRWHNKYQVEWLLLAVVEALYLGRYKAVCVEQILTLWERRGQPVYHFNSEFQNIITKNILTNLTSQIDTQSLQPEKLPSLSESKPPEYSTSTSVDPSSNPFKASSKNTAQDLVEHIPVKTNQSKIKHTDFYTKLKAFVKKSQASRSNQSKPDRVK
ncbi:MAG: hypothetical protein F6K18_16520 [Okeania sp. SIO2C2]|uniref:hypothetical protein n=1 Tax=Okeania sp. SIO2C2 TaxID=2607787 RepID=UPI0013B77534|nr:hypothetical protein [Okeania sp. SIO2C2]NEP88301.1 hypothetical protein [Okeania sp. SIO2C2]